MNSKNIALLGLLALLGGSYIYYFTDFVHPPRIQILKSNRPIFRGKAGAGILPIAFMLDGRYELTGLRVVCLPALATNKHAAPVWWLTSKSNSIPIKAFYYGQRIEGMNLYPTNSTPQQLQTNVPYRLYVESGRARGEVDFTAQPLPGM